VQETLHTPEQQIPVVVEQLIQVHGMELVQVDQV
jgi:hypothetical protein